MPGSNGNGLRPEEEHVLGMSNTEDVSSVNDEKKSVTAWLGLASAVGGGALNLWMNERNNRYNREQNEQAYLQNLQMWNLQNAYNLPANQIARLKQAGLNPNLIYGNPDNTASAPPEKEASKGERGQVDPMAIANALLMEKQMEEIESQKEVNDATARDLNAEAALKEDDLNYRPKLRALEEESRRIADKYTRKATDKLDQEIKTEEYVTELSKISVDRAREELDEYKELRPLRKQKLEEGIKELISKRGRNEAEKAYLYKMASFVSKQESILDYQEQLYELYLTPQYYDPSANGGKGGYISEAEKRMKAESIMQSLEQELLQNQVSIDNATFKDRYENATREAEYQNTWWSIFWDEYVGSITSSVGKAFSGTASVQSSVPRKIITKGK